MKQTTLNLIFILLLTGITHHAIGQNTYEDLQGRFVIDLPKGWALQPQTNDKLYIFKGKDKSLIVEYNEDNNDTDELFLNGLTTLKSSGLSNPETHTETKDLKINGLPAKWGVYQSDYDASGTTVTLYGLLGSLGIQDQGLYAIAILNKKDLKKWGAIIETIFQSFRLPGEQLTGVQEVSSLKTPNDPDMSEPPMTNETTAVEEDSHTKKSASTRWTHDEFSITLPKGWQEQEGNRAMEKEMIGWFNYEPIAGANSMLFCYQGIIWNRKLISQTADKTVKAAIPDAELIKSYVTKLANNKKANVLVYTGTGVSNGNEVELGSVNIIYRGGKCVLHQLGLGPLKDISTLEKQLLAIANSVE
ncbi:hypothetical protein [Spongiimicrobium sp. 3-5]|uniref:hypothetical protein n=1 Tax=Spongiimicrobium sp. 3-5 TaxID=3332596 RepID=UPI00397FFFE5